MTSNTYVLNVTRGKEFDVEAELKAIGATPWVPRALVSKKVPERKTPIWYDRPYVHKIVFAVFPAVLYPDVKGLKHVIGKPTSLTATDIKGIPECGYGESKTPARPGLVHFRKAVEDEYAATERLRDNAEWTCAYTPGQALTVLSGPFEGFPAVFKDAVKSAHDDFAKLRVEIDLMGRPTQVEIEPLGVARG